MDSRKRFNLVYGVKTAALVVLVGVLAGTLDQLLMPQQHAMPRPDTTAAPVASAPSVDYPLPPEQLRADSRDVEPPPATF